MYIFGLKWDPTFSIVFGQQSIKELIFPSSTEEKSLHIL